MGGNVQTIDMSIVGAGWEVDQVVLLGAKKGSKLPMTVTVLEDRWRLGRGDTRWCNGRAVVWSRLSQNQTLGRMIPLRGRMSVWL